MPTLKPIEYGEASPKIRAVVDDIKRTRRVEDVNNFWKYLARDPAFEERLALGVVGGLEPALFSQMQGKCVRAP